MNIERTKAIILRRVNYGESDRILTLLTPNGQREAIARGVRREKSKLAGGIELFAVSDIVLRSGRGDLGILTSARLESFFGNILNNYERLQFGYEVTKLVRNASYGIDESEWYRVLRQTYEGLNSSSLPLNLIQTWFYIRFAELNGYALNLKSDTNGDELSRDELYRYDLSEKGLKLSEEGNITSEHIKLLRIIANKDLEIISKIGGIDKVLFDCWSLSRQHADI